MKFRFLSIFFLFSNIIVSAQISMPKVFSNHMVLQRDIEIPVWGNAPAGTEITIQFGNTQT